MGATLVKKTTRVLIVDDEQETLDLIEEYLLGHDFDVTTAMSGEQAIAFVQKDLFHIAIVDLHLPGMTGSELLKSIKRIRSDIQAVMITGYGTIRDAVECMKLGASDFITKPILLRPPPPHHPRGYSKRFGSKKRPSWPTTTAISPVPTNSRVCTISGTL